MSGHGDEIGLPATVHSVPGAAETTHVRVSAAPAEPPEGSGAAAKYELGDELGRGGMGLVFEARDRQLGRSVALKALHPPLADDAIVLRRFLMEAQVGAQLEHPNIVPVYAMEDDDGAPAFSMRLLPGQTLRDYLSECQAQLEAGALDEDHVLPARLERLLKVCDAIEYAHSRGVIHRDLKPANVILGRHHEVYLVDWGIAKVLSVEDPDADPGRQTLTPEEIVAAMKEAVDVNVDLDTATRHGEMIGTPTYMPPEQATGRIELHGPASDQYALGMMLQQLVTLAPPRGGAPMEQVFSAIRGEREPLQESIAGRPVLAALLAIVERATAMEVESRYPSVEAFADDVRRFVRGEEVSVLPDPWSRRIWKRLSRRPGLVIGLIASLLVLASLGVAASAYRTASTQRRAAQQSERLSVLTSQVVGISERIDERFARSRTLVEGLGVAIEELHHAGAPVDGALRYGVAGRLVTERGPPLARLHPVERYGFEVSWATPLYLYPPGVSFEEVEHTIRVMAPLHRRFRGVLLRSLEDDAVTWPFVRQEAALDAAETPLHVTYVGFENGLLLNYPGYVPFPDDYDPRRRPWYREAREHRGVSFGSPYPDASGSAILVPCNRAVRDPAGRLLGVAGADMALDDLTRDMRIDHPGWRRSSLVTRAGAQIIDTEQAGLRLGVGLHGDAPIEALTVEPEVLARVERDGTGFVHVGNELVVFDRLEAIDWTFVVRLDAREAL